MAKPRRDVEITPWICNFAARKLSTGESTQEEELLLILYPLQGSALVMILLLLQFVSDQLCL